MTVETRRWTCLLLAASLLVAATLALGVLAGGCKKPGGGGATGEDKPTVTEVWVTAKPATPSGTERKTTIKDTAGLAEVTVGTGALELGATLSPLPPDGWYDQNVKLDGQAPAAATLSGGQIVYEFGAGEAGQEITLTVASVVPGSGQGQNLTVILKRAGQATVTLRYRLDGQWRDVLPGEVLSGQPLELLLSFTAPMDQASVAAALSGTGLGSGGTWLNPQEFAFSVFGPPSLLRIDLATACDLQGVPLANGDQVITVYTGEPPQLYVLDAGVSLEQPVCQLMADVCAAAVSPDGRTLLVEAYKDRTGDIGAWLFDLTDGSRRALDGVYYPAWIAGSYLLRFDASGQQIAYQVLTTAGTLKWMGTLPENLNHYSLSPDGKSLAGLVATAEPAAPGYLVPNDLVVVDLESGSSRRFEDVATVYTGPTGAGPLAGPAWSSDGKLVAVLGDLAKGSVIRVVDLQTSLVTQEVPLPDVDGAAASFFSWSPRGDYWIFADTVMATAPPYLVRGAKPAGMGEPAWSANGVWFTRCLSSTGWDDISLYRIDAIMGPVLERSLGQGFSCGWDGNGKFYYIKWDGADQRYTPEWG